jgi:hypothetical protein
MFFSGVAISLTIMEIASAVKLPRNDVFLYIGVNHAQ